MNKRSMWARTTAGAMGVLVLVGVATAAVADEIDGDEVDVKVEIAQLPSTGALTMGIAQPATALVEAVSADAELRVFSGTLPTVTITDDREQVPDGVAWYVTGQSSSFTAQGLSPLGAEHLGWTPELITDGDGVVAAGDEVGTVFDTDDAPNNVGLVGQELLAITEGSAEAHTTGMWKADADLVLKTPVDVAPGSYTATLTLSLWEDAL